MAHRDTPTYHIQLTITKNRDTVYHWYDPRGTESLDISVPEAFFSTKQLSVLVDELTKKVDSAFNLAEAEAEAERLKAEAEAQVQEEE